MATYSPTTREVVIPFTAGQNQADRAITTISKNSMVCVIRTGGAGLRLEDISTSNRYATYYTVSGQENIISETIGGFNNSLGGITSGYAYVPAGSSIRTNFQTSSGTANLELRIIEID